MTKAKREYLVFTNLFYLFAVLSQLLSGCVSLCTPVSLVRFLDTSILVCNVSKTAPFRSEDFLYDYLSNGFFLCTYIRRSQNRRCSPHEVIGWIVDIHFRMGVVTGQPCIWLFFFDIRVWKWMQSIFWYGVPHTYNSRIFRRYELECFWIFSSEQRLVESLVFLYIGFLSRPQISKLIWGFIVLILFLFGFLTCF